MSAAKDRRWRRYTRPVAILAACALALLTGCASDTRTVSGPGMIVTFNNVTPHTTVFIRDARLPSGKEFASPGSLSPGREPLRTGKTMGGSSDNRELPEWIDFFWLEWEYDRRHTREELSALPLHQRRVNVRDRVPQDVVEEVIASKRAAKPGKLSEKHLEFYFIWYPGETRFRWALHGQKGVLRSGGDQFPVTVW